MARLSNTDYLSIIADYDTALATLDGVSTNYGDAATTILVTNVFDPEIDLLVAFHNAYLVAQGAYATAPASAISAVNALQRHVLNQGSVVLPTHTTLSVGDKYVDINDYYEDFPVKFPTGGSAVIGANFATMSAQAGHTIDATYVVA